MISNLVISSICTPAILPLGTNPREYLACVHRDKGSRMLKEVLFSTAKHAEPTYPSVGELEYVPTMASYTTATVNEPIGPR